MAQPIWKMNVIELSVKKDVQGGAVRLENANPLPEPKGAALGIGATTMYLKTTVANINLKVAPTRNSEAQNHVCLCCRIHPHGR